MSKVSVQLYAICFVALLVFFGGCHQLEQADGGHTSSRHLESKSLLLRASAGRVYLSPATEEERQVRTLHAFLFDREGQALQEIVSATRVDSDQAEWKVRGTKAGTYQMILLANAPEVAQSLQLGCSIEDMERYLITKDARSGGTDGFVMRHKGKKPIPVTLYEGRGIDMRHRTILLERLAARVDINLLATSYQIKSVQLLHAATQSQVYNNNGSGKTLADRQVTAVDATEYTAKLYLYEHNSNDEEANKTKLQIICAYKDGTTLEPITIPFDIIKRNHLYHVKLTEKESGVFDPADPLTPDQTLIPSIEVRDWSVGAIFRVDRPHFDALVKPKEPRYNPLAYVAKWNVTTEKTWDRAWVYHEDPEDTKARMSYYKAEELGFMGFVSIEGSQEQYYIPSIYHWQSIMPYKNEYIPTNSYVYFDGKERLYTNVTNRDAGWDKVAAVDGKTFYPTSDFWTTTLTIKGKELKCTVALRYKGGQNDADSIEKYCRSAWLYYRGEMKVTRIVNGQPEEKQVPGMYIHALNIVDMQDITWVKQLDAAWWEQHLDQAALRFFPTTETQYTIIPGKPKYNVQGQYMTSTRDNSNHDVYTLEFDGDEASPTHHSAGSESKISVRLFSRTPLE